MQKKYLSVLLIVLFSSGYLIMLLVQGSPTGPEIEVGSSTLTSSDWAGYVASSDLQNPQPEVTGVNGSWIVPQIGGSLSDTFSAIWVGVGGFFDGTLIQAGSEQDRLGGSDYYSVWYELLPSDSITIDSINVVPGDIITVAVRLVDSATNTWSIEVQDMTNGGSFKESFRYDSSKLSAEWIAERPDVNNTTSTLANFGNVTFTGSGAVISSQSEKIGALPFAQVSMTDKNAVLATVSSLSSDGSTFTVNYAESNSLSNNFQFIIVFALILAIVSIWTRIAHSKPKY